ncbi:peptidase M20 [Sporolactobacillus sp. THM7-7]|nr:peptidase M20 [Sporolactobacillus sp. THM7-7]
MYEKIKNLPLDEQAEAVTRDLVAVRSVNGTTGEADIADRLEAIIRSFPYFQNHPDHVWSQKLNGDSLNRRNVFALLECPDPTSKTVIYHGHIDTVGTDDFGAIERFACDPDDLQRFFKNYNKEQEVREDAASGDWLFGRGALDMKSGDAVHLCNLLYYSQHREILKGNLLVMFNPVEENDHEGVMEAVSELNRLKKERHLQYLLAINTDFVSPLYKGDPHRYVYTGSAGKLLGCFYIRGRETHVGETLSGIDPTLIASKINDKLNNNMDYAEKIPGEVTLPPSCLFQRERKAFYNVQTAGAAYLYFNEFFYEKSPRAVLDDLTQVAKTACTEAAEFLKAQYRVFSDNCGLKGQAPDWDVAVMPYSAFAAEVSARGVDVEAVIEKTIKAHPGEDFRLISYKMIEELEAQAGDKRPKTIVFFAPPYCPHNYLRESIESERCCDDLLDKILSKTGEETGERFAKKRFFPYLADSSYLSMSETAKETDEIISNFPGWGRTYSIPIDGIQKLNIPVMDMGVYGKKAHTWMERVYKPYSFRVLPKMIREMTEGVLAL